VSGRPPDRFVLDPDEEHVTGTDGTRYSIAWAIDQLPWRTALPGGGMPVHQYIVIGSSTLPAARLADVPQSLQIRAEVVDGADAGALAECSEAPGLRARNCKVSRVSGIASPRSTAGSATGPA